MKCKLSWQHQFWGCIVHSMSGYWTCLTHSSFNRCWPQVSTHPRFPPFPDDGFGEFETVDDPLFPLASDGKLSSRNGPRFTRYAARMDTARTDISSPRPSQTYTSVRWSTWRKGKHLWACVHTCQLSTVALPWLLFAY